MSGATFKGSPGPWTTDHTCFDSKIPIRGGVTAYGRPYVIAHVNRPGSAFAGQDKANASLIVAAPDLLMALQVVRMSRGWQYMSDETKALIEAAISKALSNGEHSRGGE